MLNNSSLSKDITSLSNKYVNIFVFRFKQIPPIIAHNTLQMILSEVVNVATALDSSIDFLATNIGHSSNDVYDIPKCDLDPRKLYIL